MIKVSCCTYELTTDYFITLFLDLGKILYFFHVAQKLVENPFVYG